MKVKNIAMKPIGNLVLMLSITVKWITSRIHSSALVLACVLICATNLAVCAADGAFSFVEYDGSRIQLTRSYSDFREYKDDPHNLDVRAIAAVENLVRHARFGPSFDNIEDLGNSLDGVTFPGYGSFYANQLGAKIDLTLELVYIEIPQRGLNRYFAVEKQSNGKMLVVDDFVAKNTPEITRVHRKNGRLVYCTSKGAEVEPMRR